MIIIVPYVGVYQHLNCGEGAYSSWSSIHGKCGCWYWCYYNVDASGDSHVVHVDDAGANMIWKWWFCLVSTDDSNDDDDGDADSESCVWWWLIIIVFGDAELNIKN